MINLIFEDSTEGQTFWEQINTQIHLEYDYHHQISLSSFQKGGLLGAINFNCPFMLTYGLDVFLHSPYTIEKLKFAAKILQ